MPKQKTHPEMAAAASFEVSLNHLRKVISKFPPQKNTVQLRPALMEQMTSQAQFMGIDVETLTGMVLIAFLDLAKENKWMKLPLMFQEVDTD
jgi:hypothetical protein